MTVPPVLELGVKWDTLRGDQISGPLLVSEVLNEKKEVDTDVSISHKSTISY